MATKAKAAAAAAAATAPATAPVSAAPDAKPVEPSGADVAAVTAAAGEADKATASPEEAKALEVAGSAGGFEAAASVGIVSAPVVLVESPLDEARARAQALADAENEQETPAARMETPEFPFDLRVLNNSSVTLTEKVSGQLLPAGGSATITLHDEAHASKVGNSLYELAKENYLPPGVLAFQLA